MRNYIILNGTNSNTITGLLIQSLAPISKPLMRTEIEEIDGRDGDIVTPLGFSAYDKQITIGLYGTYDINAIIAFFNSEGTVTFSNEPDKYYNYQIYDQIDFERLVRFKTATVTLHCQPFKFATTGESQTLSGGDPVSDEGTNLVLEGSGEAPFSQFDLKGNTEQTGTPTPSAPIAVKTVTGGNEIRITGKNLFDGSIYKTGYIIANDGTETANANYVITNAFEVKPNTKYTASGELPSGDSYIRVAYYDANMGFIRRESQAVPYTRTSPADAKYARLSYMNTATEVQFEEGQEATPYEETQVYEVNLASIELCKINSNQDYLYKSGDKWYKHKAIGKEILSSSSNWAVRTDTTVSGCTVFRNISYVAGVFATNSKAISSHFKHASSYSANTIRTVDVNEYGLTPAVENSATGIESSDSNSTKVTKFKTWLDNNTVSVYYILTTPVEEEITNETLIEQLNDIVDQAHAYRETTHVGSTYATGNVPHIIAATVVGDASGTITNAGNIYSKPKLTVYGSGDIGIYLNGVQMFQIALGSDGYITIDTNLMEAYKDNLQTLKNRQVTGDYSSFKLPVGQSTISFSGIVTSCVVENFSRWL